ncbi:30S ribosomal protein S15 [Candidatus Pacearchaeota archaeon]|nr:30S ribosomal protein S15 [Candidatus Pacearchaeota archaeon]
MAEEKPNWVKMKPAELEKLVVDMAKKGMSPEKIGLALRDQHAIPRAKLVGKKISVIMKENGIPLKSEKETILASIERMKAHAAKNKHDHSASRAITKQLWAIHRLERK